MAKLLVALALATATNFLLVVTPEETAVYQNCLIFANDSFVIYAKELQPAQPQCMQFTIPPECRNNATIQLKFQPTKFQSTNPDFDLSQLDGDIIELQYRSTDYCLNMTSYGNRATFDSGVYIVQCVSGCGGLKLDRLFDGVVSQRKFNDSVLILYPQSHPTVRLSTTNVSTIDCDTLNDSSPVIWFNVTAVYPHTLTNSSKDYPVITDLFMRDIGTFVIKLQVSGKLTNESMHLNLTEMTVACTNHTISSNQRSCEAHVSSFNLCRIADESLKQWRINYSKGFLEYEAEKVFNFSVTYTWSYSNMTKFGLEYRNTSTILTGSIIPSSDDASGPSTTKSHENQLPWYWILFIVLGILGCLTIFLLILCRNKLPCKKANTMKSITDTDSTTDPNGAIAMQTITITGSPTNQNHGNQQDESTEKFISKPGRSGKHGRKAK